MQGNVSLRGVSCRVPPPTPRMFEARAMIFWACSRLAGRCSVLAANLTFPAQFVKPA